MLLFIFPLILSALSSNLPCASGKIVGVQGSHGPVVNMHFRDDSQKESWAYVTVRPKAHMFYWLYYAESFENRPLIMWLQGGPGGSSTGFGNFEELGPLDVNLKPRNTTWLQVASLLFVDNPVGTGYSYVEDDSAYTTNVEEISADLLTLVKRFIKNHSEFQKIPFYIFSESYGGKMTAAFSDVLHDAIKNGDLKMNFKGFAMGDSWISPVDSVLSWGPFLYANSIVNQHGLALINEGAKKCEKLVAEGKFAEAEGAWSELEDVIEEVGSDVDFYNINKFGGESQGMQKSNREKLYDRHVKVMLGDDLSNLMNGPIRKKLKIIPDSVSWGGQSENVFHNQIGDFMKNVTSTVNKLINEGKLKVIVYSGQLDLICDVLGTEAWFSRLDVSKEFSKIRKNQYSCGVKEPCFFGSNYKNVSFYWILSAGHMVPSDNGPGALGMVSRIIKD